MGVYLCSCASYVSLSILACCRPLQNRVESRKRGLQFNLPVVVPVGQHCRLVESNTSIISLQDIYERYCQEVGMSKDDPIMAYTEKLKDILKASKNVSTVLLAENTADRLISNRILLLPLRNSKHMLKLRTRCFLTPLSEM